MTDVTGEFNRVIMEHEAKDLAEFDAGMKDYARGRCSRSSERQNTPCRSRQGAWSLRVQSVRAVGIEPTTYGLKVRCSTD